MVQSYPVKLSYVGFPAASKQSDTFGYAAETKSGPATCMITFPLRNATTERQIMQRIRTGIVGLALLALAACDSDNFATIQPQGGTTETANIQVLHASPDAPAVNILLNGVTVVSELDYKAGTGQLERSVGTYSVAVDGLLADGTTTTVIGPVDLTFDADTTYSIAAVGPVSAIEPVVLSQPRTPVSAGSARLFVLHGAASAPEVDVFVTTPGADLTASAPTGTFEFKGTIGPAEVGAGDYQIRVTPAGDPTTVVYDSGTVNLADGNDLFITAVPSTNAGAAPISLVAQTGDGSIEILDSATPASLRVFHTSPDAPAVDVVVNDDFAAPLIPNLSFPDFVGYVNVPAADYNVKVTPAGNMGVIVIDADLTLDAGQAYDVLAVDTLAAIEPLVLNDDPRPVATEAKVRIVHASPTAQDVDIYVMAPGTDINDADPVFEVIPFKASTGYVSLPAGSYDVAVTPTGSKTAAIGPATFDFSDGDVLTVVARDNVGGGIPLNVIVTNDSIAP